MKRLPLFLVAAVALLVARPALAGPPLLCFPFDIGAAKSLPMAGKAWHEIDPKYDVSRLVEDTLAILTSEAPVPLRMETMRRATLYAAKHPQIAEDLLTAFEQRARAASSRSGLHVFDFGYLVETYKEAKPVYKMTVSRIDTIDGYQLVLKARALASNPSMDFAAEKIASGYPKNATK